MNMGLCRASSLLPLSSSPLSIQHNVSSIERLECGDFQVSESNSAIVLGELYIMHRLQDQGCGNIVVLSV